MCALTVIFSLSTGTLITPLAQALDEHALTDTSAIATEQPVNDADTSTIEEASLPEEAVDSAATAPAPNKSDMYGGAAPVYQRMRRGIQSGASQERPKRKLLVVPDTAFQDSAKSADVKKPDGSTALPDSISSVNVSHDAPSDSLPTVSFHRIGRNGKIIISLTAIAAIGGFIAFFLIKKKIDADNVPPETIPDPPDPPDY